MRLQCDSFTRRFFQSRQSAIATLAGLPPSHAAFAARWRRWLRRAAPPWPHLLNPHVPSPSDDGIIPDSDSTSGSCGFGRRKRRRRKKHVRFAEKADVCVVSCEKAGEDGGDSSDQLVASVVVAGFFPAVLPSRANDSHPHTFDVVCILYRMVVRRPWCTDCRVLSSTNLMSQMSEYSVATFYGAVLHQRLFRYIWNSASSPAIVSGTSSQPIHDIIMIVMDVNWTS